MPVKVFMVNFAYNISLAAILMVMPLYLRDLGVAPFVLGLAASLPPLVQLLLRLPGGSVTDRVGERTVLLFSAGTMLLSAAFLVAAPGGATALTTVIVALALVVSGVSRAVYWPAAQSYTSRWTKADLTRSLGVFTSVGHTGAIVGGPLAGALLAWRGFGAGFGLVAAGAFLGLAISLQLNRPTTRPTAGPAAGPAAGRTTAPDAPGSSASSLLANLREMMGSRALLLAGLCMAGSGIPLALLGSFYPVYLADMGMRPDAIGLLTSCRAVTATLSSLAAGMAGARITASGKASWLLGASLCAVGIGATPYLSSFAGLAIAIALLGLSSGLLQVLSMSLTSRASHSGNRAQAMAFTGMFYSVALWLVPILMGLIAELTGVRAGFVILGASWLAITVGVATPAGRITRSSAALERTSAG